MIRQANEDDIPIMECILTDAVRWMDSQGLHQWEEKNVQWDRLSKFFSADDFCIAFDNDMPVACMALVDYDPVFWPDIPKGESLYLHKVAVLREYAGKGFSTALIDYAKAKARGLGIKTLRLDCHMRRAKVRTVYEKHGFVCVEEKLLFGKYETAFYVCDLSDCVLKNLRCQ